MFKDVNFQYNVDEMMQVLVKNDRAFAYCYQYFIEDVESYEFIEGFLRPKMAQGFTEREAIAEYMAEWIPWEPSREHIVKRINAMIDNYAF